MRWTRTKGGTLNGILGVVDGAIKVYRDFYEAYKGVICRLYRGIR